MKFTVAILLLSSSFAFAQNYYYSFGKKNELHSLKNTREIKEFATVHYFSRTNGQKVGLMDTLIVSFRKGVNTLDILKNLNLKKVEELGAGMVLLKAKTSEDVLSACAKLFESGSVNFAEPNFIREMPKRATVSDPLYAKAWHLHNTTTTTGAHINVESAWDTTKGSGVKIAIFDDAVDSAHEDFNLEAQYNAITQSSDSSPDKSDDAHGTFVAGLALAKENNLGSTGVAPEATLLAIKGAVGLTSTDASTIRAFEWAKTKGADVMNNSWGGYNITQAVKTAIEDAANNGRNGKGMIIVFGHGNDKCSDSDPVCYKDGDTTTIGLGQLSNDESSLELVIAVGATNHENRRATYSNYGKYLDLSAPGGDGDNIFENIVGMVSTDISGDLGWSKTEYLNVFGETITGDSNPNYISEDPFQVGTSYASPVVAGVAALVIAANPNLTRAQIFDILQTTADKVGGYTYTNGRSNELGYGKVNAGAAVTRAVELKNTTISSTFDYGFNGLSTGWHLLGAVDNLGDIKSQYSLQSVYTYTNGQWNLNPTLILKGSGFWISK